MKLKIVVDPNKNIEGAYTSVVDEIWLIDDKTGTKMNLTEHVDLMRFQSIQPPIEVGKAAPEPWDPGSEEIIILALKMNFMWEKLPIKPKNPNYICSACLYGFDKPVVLIRSVGGEETPVPACPNCENYSFRAYDDHIKMEEQLEAHEKETHNEL